MNFYVKDLPHAVQRALASVGYKKRDVSVEARPTYVLHTTEWSGGYQSFNVIVDLRTGAHQSASAGEATIFARQPIDRTDYPLDDHTAVIQGSHGGGDNRVSAGIRVTGTTLDAWKIAAAPATHQRLAQARPGHGRYAGATEKLVAVDAALEKGVSLAEALSVAEGPLTDMEKAVLNAYGGLTSAGRKNEFERWIGDARFKSRENGVAVKAAIEAATDALVARGYLKKNKAGAVQITMEGKNARQR